MEPLNLAICDDLPEEREKLLALLAQAPVPTACPQFGSSEDLLAAFRPGKFDLLLMARLQKDNAPRLTVRQNGQARKLPLSELVSLEQKGHHVLLFRKDGSVLRLYGKLSGLLPQLEGQPFFCPHKSYCVNLAFVRSIHEEYACYEMADGQRVPISRPNRARARRAYEDFLFARTRGDG